MGQRNASFNFTKKSLDALHLPRKGKRLYVYDTKVKGLELMTTAAGAKSFKVYKKFQDRPIRVTLGKYPGMTIEQARNEAQRVIAEMIKGKNPNEEKKVKLQFIVEKSGLGTSIFKFSSMFCKTSEEKA